MANVVVTRLQMLQGRAPVFKVRGEYVDADDAEAVRIPIGETSEREGVAWWDLPLPACVDCGGEVVWAEAGRVPGARECTTCGSLYAVETERDEQAVG